MKKFITIMAVAMFVGSVSFANCGTCPASQKKAEAACSAAKRCKACKDAKAPCKKCTKAAAAKKAAGAQKSCCPASK